MFFIKMRYWSHYMQYFPKKQGLLFKNTVNFLTFLLNFVQNHVKKITRKNPVLQNSPLVASHFSNKKKNPTKAGFSDIFYFYSLIRNNDSSITGIQTANTLCLNNNDIFYFQAFFYKLFYILSSLRTITMCNCKDSIR